MVRNSFTIKLFSQGIGALQQKISSLGKQGTFKIIGSITTLVIFVTIMTSMGGKSLVVAFADNSINIKDIDDAYISLDGAIIDDDQSFGARFAYMVKPGDTLEVIAREFGVTVKSLKNTNGLSSSTIKPGQQLIISNVDGFIYQVTEQTTIRDLAHKYRLELQDLKELNALQNDHDVLKQGDQVFVPLTLEEGKQLGLIIPEPEPEPEPVVVPPTTTVVKQATKTTVNKTAPTTTQSSKTQSVAVGGVRRVSQSRSSCFGFVPGQCTCYAAQKRPDIFVAGKARPFGGNAKNWYDNARNAGFDVGTKPAIGAVAVMPMGWGGYGHVGIVVDFDENRVLLESMNWVGPYIVNRVWISNSRIKGYIY